MQNFITNHLSQLVEIEALVVLAGIIWNIFRETKKGITLEKLVKDIDDAADGPLVEILKKTFQK